MHAAASPSPNPLSMTADEFVAACAGRMKGGRAAGLAAYRAFHRTGSTGVPELDPLLPPIVRTLRSESAEGEVVKFLLKVPAPSRTQELGPPSQDRGLRTQASGPAPPPAPSPSHRLILSPPDLETESVIIPMIGRTGRRTHTLCVSSQVGCAMGCAFCETAQMGLMRSLTAAEIVAQYHAATQSLGAEIRNIVFMGMGEPLDNLDQVLRAIAVLTDHHGPEFPMSKVVVSTVGRIDGLRLLAEQVRKPGWHRLNLAVSLNAPNDEIRSRIMPINRGMPMAALREALLEWPLFGGNKICVEYVLIPGVNDARENAAELAEFLRPIVTPPSRGLVNVIPYNPRRNSPWPAPSEQSVIDFLGWLTGHGVYCKRRRTKGRDMMGACGQLGNEGIRGRKVVGAA